MLTYGLTVCKTAALASTFHARFLCAAARDAENSWQLRELLPYVASYAEAGALSRAAMFSLIRVSRS